MTTRGCGLLLLVPLAWGCETRQAPRLAADPGAYVLRDSADYENPVAGGKYALLVRNGEVVDSVDLWFGVHRLNSGTVVFLPVRTSGADQNFVETGTTSHVAYDGKRRILLASFLPHFNDYFSSPAVWDGILYYWGMEKIPGTEETKLHAIRYDALARRIDSRFLFQAQLTTDYRAYLGRPTLEGGMMLFETFGHAFLVSPDFQRVKPTTPSR